MTIWRYKAVAIDGDSSSPKHGELAAESAFEVRAALRRIGLQVIDLRPRPRPRNPGKLLFRRTRRFDDDTTTRDRTSRTAREDPQSSSFPGALSELLARHLRRRRAMPRADLYDSLATLLESGVSLLEAIETIGRGRNAQRGVRSMLLEVRESLRGGVSLADAFASHEGWFDPIEIAMLRAGQHAGDLPSVLRTLADRQEQSSALAQKLIAALSYPAIVTVVALGVVTFLSVKTLPGLVQILTDANVEAPALTLRVMSFGRFFAEYWILIGILIFTTPFVIALIRTAFIRFGVSMPHRLRRLTPQLLRRMAMANACRRLAELLRTGVPFVDALRIISSSCSSGLRIVLTDAASRIEHGDEPSRALEDDHYFDGEVCRLIAIGQQAGELDAILLRIAARIERQAQRMIDRLSALLEPAIILILAALVGTVVMAAILPLLRIQEII